jgi:tRNA nucleotidyltransferase (CCA-adding enzyme)
VPTVAPVTSTVDWSPDSGLPQFLADMNPSSEELAVVNSVFRDLETVFKKDGWHARTGLTNNRRPAKLEKGGSVAKQTSLKGTFDLDVVACLPKFDLEQIAEYQRCYEAVLDKELNTPVVRLVWRPSTPYA